MIHDAEPRPTERLSVAEILSHSSNVGAITLSRLLGTTSLSHWIDRFGFGKPTGIDFPGESQGNVAPVDKWYGSIAGDIPIGQGIAVTPLQMAAAYAAIANGGVWREPHLVDHVAGHKGPRVKTTADRLGAGRARDDADAPRRRRRGRRHGHPGARPRLQRRGEDRDRGQAGRQGRLLVQRTTSRPSSAPCRRRTRGSLILVAVDSPRCSIWGGVVAAPAFSDIARFDLQYLEVLPDAAVATP